VVTEIMPNPAGTDTGKEWFEVLVKTEVDLNELQLGTAFPTVQQTIGETECIHVRPGQYLVFAGNDGTVDDGGLPRVDVRFKFALPNSDRGVFLASDGTLVDEAKYATVTEGAARSLSASALDATMNDVPENWCDATASYGAGGKGTPGDANPECP